MGCYLDFTLTIPDLSVPATYLFPVFYFSWLIELMCNWSRLVMQDAAVTTSLSEKSALVEAEGFALVMLCQCRPLARRLAVHILRESRAVLHLINLTATANRQTINEGGEEAIAPPEPSPVTSTPNNDSNNRCCIDLLDSLAPTILQRVLPLLPPHERVCLPSCTFNR